MAIVGGGVRDSSVLLHWVPVDFVSKSIVAVTKSTPSNQMVFNIVAEGPLLREVIDVMVEEIKNKKSEEKEIKFEALSPGQWVSKVEAKITHEFPTLYPLKDQFTSFNWYGAPTYTDAMSSSTKAVLQNLNIEWHKITKEDIHKTIQYFITSNIL